MDEWLAEMEREYGPVPAETLEWEPVPSETLEWAVQVVDAWASGTSHVATATTSEHQSLDTTPSAPEAVDG